MNPRNAQATVAPVRTTVPFDVDRQPRELQSCDGVGDEVVIELDQRGERRSRELPEPVGHGARRRNARQPAEARDQGIAGEIAEVLQPTGPDVEQRQDEQGEAAPAIVSARGRTGGAQSTRQRALPQVAPEQLQAAVRGQLLGHELDMQWPLDHPSQARYAQSHQRGLLCVGSDMGMSSLKSAQGAFLIPVDHRSFMPQLFSDWG